jgi:dienelactone hydrolase
VEFVHRLAAGDYAGVVAQFDSTMAARVSAELLQQIWQQVQAQAGPYRTTGAAVEQQQDGFDIAVVTTQFERASLDAVIAFDSTGKVGGLHFRPSAESDAGAAAPASDAAYVDTTAFSDQPVAVGPFNLPGTLSVPHGAGPFPAVVLVHGSGPNDQDETVGGTKVFRDLARGLASRGVAVLRYEKRTRAHPETLPANLTVRDETIDDARAGAALLAATPRVDRSRIVVVGHSLGGMLAPRIATGDSTIDAIVIMAGTTRPLPDVIIGQLNYLESITPAADTTARTQFEQLRKGAQEAAALTASDSGSSQPVLGAPVSYWLDLAQHDPAGAAARLHRPMLILQGGRDYQVTDQDFAGWKRALAGRSDVTFKSYPSLNHLFVTGEGPSTPAEYAKPAHVAQQVVDDIAGWVKSLSGPAAPHP